MASIQSAMLVFAFPGCVNQTVTADGTLQYFLQHDVIKLCSTSQTSNPRYANSVERSRCTSSLFPASFRGKQDKLAFDRANFAMYVRHVSSVKPRGMSASQAIAPPIPVGTLFGDDMTHLFQALDSVCAAWNTALSKQIAPPPYCCEFYHTSRTPYIYAMNKGAQGVVEAVPIPVQPTTVSRKRTRDEKVATTTTAADYDPDDEKEPIPASTKRSAWGQLTDTLCTMPVLDPRLQKSIADFITTASTGAPYTSPFLTVQAIADHVRVLNTHQLCEYLVALGYVPWYFNRLNPMELSLHGVHANTKHATRLFILDEAMERKVHQLQRSHFLPPPPPPQPSPNSQQTVPMSRSTSQSSFVNLLQPCDFGSSVDGLFDELSQGVRATPLHKVARVQSH